MTSASTGMIWGQSPAVSSLRGRTATFVLAAVVVAAVLLRMHACLRYERMHFATDGYLYYVHAHSWYLDGDCDYRNNLLEAPGLNQRQTYLDLVSSAGRVSVAHQVGVSLIALPFLALADGMTLAHNAMGFHPLPRDGFSRYYHVVVPLGLSLFGVAGVLLTYVLLSRYFSSDLAAVATAAAWLSTSALYFVSAEPTMSHAVEITLASGMVLAADTIRRCGWTPWRAVALGLSTGMMVAVRYYDVVWVSIPLMMLFPGLWILARRDQDAGPSRFMPMILAAVAVLVAATCLTPQVLVNLATDGTVLGRVGQNYAPGNWFSPHVFVEILQPRSGLLVVYPIMALAIAATIYDAWRRADRIVPCALLLAMALSVWIYSAAYVPGYSRRYSHAFVLIAWGLAAALEWGARRRVRAWVVSLLIAVACVQNAARYVLVDRQRLYRGVFTCGHAEISRWENAGVPVTTSVLAGLLDPPVQQPPP
ncbi:MAG: hypothetical protein J5J06_19645 [Phycisphaerae bacterium]|nr:hypothetical protein [Phycisphaerae bacterium]